MLCYSDSTQSSIAISLIAEQDYPHWLAEQTLLRQTYLQQLAFKAKAGQHCLLFDEDSLLQEVLVITGVNQGKVEYLAALSLLLPERTYHVVNCTEPQIFLGWGMGAYQYTRYKKAKRQPAKLYLPEPLLLDVTARIEAVYLTRDLINTPAEDMAPLDIANASEVLARQHHADCTVISEQEQIKQQFPALYTVGKGSHQPSCLIDLQWGDKTQPNITLIGKGISFDTGGLDMKPSAGMRFMKKDMGGAANVLGLAHYIMSTKLAVNLRVIIASAENSVSAEAMHPGDIIRMRNGKTVEVDNTDAEGRLVLADALSYATEDNTPDLLFSFATLTGAARVAVGTEISAYFTNNDELTRAFDQASNNVEDPVWQQPLYQPYARSLKTPFADLKNTGYGLGGAITAALFLQQFINKKPNWFHLDIMAYNDRCRPGHPEGGEAMGIATAFSFIKAFCSKERGNS